MPKATESCRTWKKLGTKGSSRWHHQRYSEPSASLPLIHLYAPFNSLCLSPSFSPFFAFFSLSSSLSCFLLYFRSLATSDDTSTFYASKPDNLHFAFVAEGLPDKNVSLMLIHPRGLRLRL